jgi:hypothetical protein
MYYIRREGWVRAEVVDVFLSCRLVLLPAAAAR